MSVLNKIPEQFQEDVEFFNAWVPDFDHLKISRHPEDRRHLVKEINKVYKRLLTLLGDLGQYDVDLVDGLDGEVVELLENLQIWEDIRP